MNNEPLNDEPLNDEPVRERLLLPVLIPVGSLAFIGFVAFSVSRVLLNVPKQVATAMALMLAFNLLLGFALVSMRPRMGLATMGLAGAAVALPLVLGAAAAAGVVKFPRAEGAEAGGGEGARITIAAKNIAFNRNQLDVPAAKPFTLVFNNQDAGVPHNVTILRAQGSADVFYRETVITGPRTVSWKVKPIAAGNYYFLCDVHPNMNGTVVVK